MSNTEKVAGPCGSPLTEGLGLHAMLPACWTLTETMEAGKTTTAGYLWFKNPKNTSWEPLYRRAALSRVLENSQATQQHNAELLAKVAQLGDALEMAVRQNEHDMLMTGEELRACRAALDALGHNAQAQAAPQAEPKA
jgi:uncharacterized protein with beta-barrel porin domain